MVLVLLLLFLLIPSLARAAIITVTAGQSIQEAVNHAQPGDTVQVGPGVFRQRIDLNGANERRITVQGTSGKTILDGTGLGNGWMIYGRHVKNMTVRHFEIRNHTGGGIGLFGDSVNVAITDNSIHDNRFVCCQGSGIRVTSRFSPTTNREQGVGVIGTAHHVTIARNTIRNITTGFTGTLADNGTETLTVAGDISHFVIEDNLIDRGQFIGIDMIGKSAAWWGQVPGQRPTPAEPWPRQGIVRRNTVTNLKAGMGGGDVGIYCDGCRDIVIEHNKVDGSSGYCYNVSTEEDGFRTEQVILRHNVGINCTSAPFGIGPASSQAHPDRHGVGAHLRVVHNTAIRTKPGGPLFRFQYAGDTQAKNNIGVNVGETPTPYVWHGVPDANAAPQLDHNLYWGGNNYFEHRGRASLSLAEHQARSGQETHSRLADPHFTNVGSRDVSVQAGSAALNSGAPLTQTVGTGSGTVVTVADARYFSDGYGMVAGDQVQIGTQTARITDIDYATHQLTLDQAVSWTDGQGVSYPFTGSAPDLGACEGVGTCTPPPTAPPVSPPATPPPPPSPTPAPPPAGALYVATTGSNSNPGTAAAPFRTVLYGVSRLTGGGTLIIKAGTYEEGNIALPSGATGAHTTVQAAPGAQVILRPAARVPQLPGVDCIWLITPGNHHLTLDGLTLDGRDASDAKSTAYPVCTQDVTAHHLTFTNGVIQYAGRNGMIVTGGFWDIRNNHIHHNGVDCCGTGGDDHGIYFGGNRSTFYKNIFDHNACYNLQIYGGVDRDLNVFDSNVFTASGCGVGLWRGVGTIFKNNVVYDDNTAGDGGVILTGANLDFFNNTIINTDVLALESGNVASVEIRNNIFCGGALAATNTTRSHNLFTCPSFMDTRTANFRVPAGSAAIDAGMTLASVTTDKDGHPRPQGARHDIGAYEFGTEGPETQPPPVVALPAPRKLRIISGP